MSLSTLRLAGATYNAVKTAERNARKALKLHDSQTAVLIEGITERANILRQIDPSLINEPRLKTGIKVIDLVINFFYDLRRSLNKDQIQHHLADYRFEVSLLPIDKQRRARIIYNLYQITLTFQQKLSQGAPLYLTDDQIIRGVNQRFGQQNVKTDSRILSPDQIDYTRFR